MIQIDFQISNDGAYAARREIRDFIRFAEDRMVGGSDDAALAYVVLKSFGKRLDRELEQIEQRAREKERQQTPTIREERG